MKIRMACENDGERLSEIYSYYVENTAVTYECIAPDGEEFRRRIAQTVLKYPYLVAEHEGNIVGYAYAGTFKPRAAYDRSVELSVYVDRNFRGRGVGRKLYEELEKELSARGFTNAYACVAYPEKEDEYLTFNSVNFHQHMGYRIAGKFNKCAYKFNRWYGSVWLEKFIGEHN